MKANKQIDLKPWEKVVQWFEEHDRGKPIEIDLNDEKGDYRCTILYYKRKLNN